MPWIANVGETHAEKWDPDDNTVVISVTEPGRKARLKGFKDMLRLEFQDYDSSRKHPEDAVLFTPTLAARIVRFARKHRDNESNILVHCAAGISRSGAIVEALLEAFPEYEDKGWKRFPNNMVRTMMKRALGIIPIGATEED